jgi:hypothetical protein
MKKLILTFILLLSFISYSQTSVSKCTCGCSKKTTVVHKKNKKPVIKKPKIKPVVKPVIKPTVSPLSSAPINITMNSYVTYVQQPEVTKKDTVIKLVEKPLVRDTPEFEVYVGVVDPKQSNVLGYMIGFNIIPNLHQIGKDGKEREWLNRYLFGFEFSGYNTSLQTIETTGSSTEVVTKPIDCDCEQSDFGGFASGSKYTFKKEVRAFSLNFGVEVYKGWYIISGVTGYNSTLIVDGEKVAHFRNAYLDLGVKKFIKVGNVYLSPMFKFNNEVTSFGVGFSYD